MIGYHYTSTKNWYKIQEEGLKPYYTKRLEMEATLGYSDIHGVWVWAERLSPRSEVGTLIFQASKRASLKLCLLEVEFEAEDILQAEKYGRMFNLVITHSGNVDRLEMHPDNPIAHIVTREIPANKVKLVQIFNLMDLVKERYEIQNHRTRTEQ